MKLPFAAAAFAFAVTPSLAQTSATTGVAHPDPLIINTTPDETVTVKIAPAKPSAAIPESTPVRRAETDAYGPYVPYSGARLANPAADAHMADPDSRIVTSVPELPGEVREGTLLHVKMREPLSTLTTAAESIFSAELTQQVEKNGRVVLPVGSLLQGRVTEVHSGRRISGRALLHLETRSIVLPDGTHYALHAQLIDSDRLNNTTVDQEGSLVRKDHAKETLAIMGATTGVAAVTGAVVGGGVGAIVGAGIGAGASTIVWLKQDRQAELPAEARLIFSLTEPMAIEADAADAHTSSARAALPATGISSATMQ